MIWPATPPAWLLPWAIWRFRPDPKPPMPPAGTPREIPKWAWSFLKWAAWRRAGGLPPKRPSGLPDKIPQWAWTTLKLIAQEVPLPSKPPPPPPPPPTPSSSWQLPMPLVFMLWNPVLDWREPQDFVPVCEKLAAAGTGTVALQIGSSFPWQADRVREAGLACALWAAHAEPDDQARLEQYGAAGYIPQVEGMYERDPAIDNLRAGVGKGLSLALITTLASLWEGEWAWFEEAGCTAAFIETYLQSGAQYGNIPAMLGAAKQVGIDHAWPTPAIYWDVNLSAYDLSSVGRNLGVYAAEWMDAMDYAELKAL